MEYCRLNKNGKLLSKQSDLDEHEFCSFCLVEYHIRHSENIALAQQKIQARDSSFHPLAIPLLIKALPEFKLGYQSDA